MRYIKPKYYDSFRCVADQCPDTCCAGWQIMIDEASLEQYAQVPGKFGQRLKNSIDWQEGAFYQDRNRRCTFLNEQNLCDLYTELGGNDLCETCCKYPRHVEEYEGLREWSLSLSCPIAAERILSEPEFPAFLEEEDDSEEELEEEFEDFDLLLFTQLEDARAVVLEHLQEAEGTLEEKMALYLQMAKQMQKCVTREAYFEIEEVVTKYRRQGSKLLLAREETRYAHRKELFTYMLKLERLRDEWSDILEDLGNTLYAGDEAHYQKCLDEFEAYITGDTALANQWEAIGIRLFVFFLYTYFCGAVYDDWIYSKMALAVESVRFIREVYICRFLLQGELLLKDYVELAYRYAREIEHSDQNLNDLEEFFMK